MMAIVVKIMEMSLIRITSTDRVQSSLMDILNVSPAGSQGLARRCVPQRVTPGPSPNHIVICQYAIAGVSEKRFFYSRLSLVMFCLKDHKPYERNDREEDFL